MTTEVLFSCSFLTSRFVKNNSFHLYKNQNCFRFIDNFDTLSKVQIHHALLGPREVGRGFFLWPREERK